MTNPNKRKGDKAEREAAELLTEVTGLNAKEIQQQGFQMMLEIFMAYQIALYKQQITKINPELVW